jgi:septal ring factor EnvC (AmiA/AmiB activator)
MTDFIHEHPKDAPDAVPPSPASAPAPAAEETEMDTRTGQKRVYGYIFILFIVAFSLLLWAFFMNQRSTDQVLSELRGNAGALQSTLDRNIALEQENELLEKKLRELENTLEKTQSDNEALTRQVAEITLERDALQSRLDQLELELEQQKEPEQLPEDQTVPAAP